MTIVAVILINSGCASDGPIVRIETPEPAEDFVVVCKWVKDGLLNIHGGKKLSDEKVFVTESSKEVDCGISIWGGEGGASVLHPLYTHMQGEDIDEVSVIRPKTKLEILEEQKLKFNSGYWDEYSNPGFLYSKSLIGCGFGNQYFDYYRKVKEVDVDHFKRLYHEPMLSCYQEKIPILKTYRASAYRDYPDAEEIMRRMWASDKWDKWNEQ